MIQKAAGRQDSQSFNEAGMFPSQKCGDGRSSAGAWLRFNEAGMFPSQKSGKRRRLHVYSAGFNEAGMFPSQK